MELFVKVYAGDRMKYMWMVSASVLMDIGNNQVDANLFAKKMKNGEMENVFVKLDTILSMEDVISVNSMKTTFKVKKDAKENAR